MLRQLQPRGGSPRRGRLAITGAYTIGTVKAAFNLPFTNDRRKGYTTATATMDDIEAAARLFALQVSLAPRRGRISGRVEGGRGGIGHLHSDSSSNRRSPACMQDLGAGARRHRGVFALTRSGEGFAWLVSPSTPLRIILRYSDDGTQSALHVDGCIGRVDLEVCPSLHAHFHAQFH